MTREFEKEQKIGNFQSPYLEINFGLEGEMDWKMFAGYFNRTLDYEVNAKFVAVNGDAGVRMFVFPESENYNHRHFFQSLKIPVTELIAAGFVRFRGRGNSDENGIRVWGSIGGYSKSLDPDDPDPSAGRIKILDRNVSAQNIQELLIPLLNTGGGRLTYEPNVIA
jgi:hypothetical protein